MSDAAGAADIRDVAERWPVASSAELARGSLLRMRTDTVRMPGGETADREVVEHPGAVAVLALDDAGRVLMIRQYRHPVGRLLWEIPAGLRDMPGEPLLAAAERELLEETGYRAADWRVLVDFFTSPGFSTERLRIFLASGPDAGPGRPDGSTFDATRRRTWMLPGCRWTTAVAGILAGDLHNGVAALGILSAYAARRGGFEALRHADAPER